MPILLISQEKLSLLDIIINGGIGSISIMLILFVLLGLVLFIYLEKLFKLKLYTDKNDELYDNILVFLKEGKSKEIANYCKNSQKTIAVFLKLAIKNADKPIEEINKILDKRSEEEVFEMERNTVFLSVISTLSPMIGFLGTVIGMIIAFYEMANSGGDIKIDTLANGLYTAMMTTAAGLIVGIASYFFYFHTVTNSEHFFKGIQDTMNDFLKKIKSNH